MRAGLMGWTYATGLLVHAGLMVVGLVARRTNGLSDIVHAKLMDCRTCARWTNPLSDLCSPD